MRTHGSRPGFVPGVHAARAIAVTMVLAAHIVGLWTALNSGVVYKPWSAYLKLFIQPLRIDHQNGGHTGLLLFFLVSGFIVSQAAEGEGRLAFIAKRAARLLPAMILATAFTVLVATLGRSQGWLPMFGYDAQRAESFHAVLDGIGLGLLFGGISTIFVLWSLHVEYMWYSLLALALPMAQKRPVLLTTVLTVALTVITLVVPTNESGSVTPTVSVWPYLLVILAGRWIYHWYRGQLGVVVAAGGTLLALIGYCVTQYRFVGSPVIGGQFPYVVATLWATAGFIALLVLVKRVWRPVAFVADISYGLYLFHIPTTWLFMPILSPGGRHFTLGLVVTLLATGLIAWACETGVERPIRRRLRARLKAGVRQPALPVDAGQHGGVNATTT